MEIETWRGYETQQYADNRGGRQRCMRGAHAGSFVILDDRDAQDSQAPGSAGSVGGRPC